MIVYTVYRTDARVKREAETLACDENYTVTVLVPRADVNVRNYVAENVNIRELNTRNYQGKSKFRYIFSYLSFLLKAFVSCTGAFLKGKIDVIHIHNMPDFLVFAAIIPRLFGKKIILDIHDTMPETYGAKFDKGSRLLRKILCLEEKISCRFAHKIICVNHIQKDIIVKRGVSPEKIEVSMNVPDVKWFNNTQVKSKSRNNSSYFTLVYHGTLAKRLGVDLTIQAVAKLIHKIPNIQFHIIGDGDDKEEFIALSKTLNVSNHVIFKGFVAVEDVSAVVNGMDIGVIANRKNVATELMLPVKMMEYIALDIPVIVPNLTTIQYYFSEDMVSYFEPDNVDSLVSAILKMHENEDLLKKQKEVARQFLDEYGWQKHQEGLINLYKNLLV